MVASFALAAAALLYTEQGLIDSPPCRDTLARLQTDPQAVSVLGSPIEVGRPVLGTFAEEDSQVTADFEIPVHGPKARGKVRVHGRRSGDDWRYRDAVLTVGGTRFEVLRSTVE